MSKLVIIRINETPNGNLLADLSIGNEKNVIAYRVQDIIIPPIDEISKLYEKFKTLYCNLGETRYRERNRVILIEPHQTTNQAPLEDCSQAAQQIEKYLKDNYFNQPAWRDLRREIEDRIGTDDSARVIIQTDNIYLKKLPWHFWDLFTRRRYAQYALSSKNSKSHPPLKYPVKILAVFGDDSGGINIEGDRLYLKRLQNHGAEIKEVIKPTRQEFTQILRSENWDILFFAGHSRSYLEYRTGKIFINDSESLAPNELRKNFTKAVEKGLKLVILNSCDGLGLATEFASYGVPHIIVMREPVPDEVAREFLKEFLDKFTSDKSFYLAVREACEYLEGIEGENPCASWLPIIYQNPDSEPLVWPQPGFNWNYISYKFKQLFKQSLSFLRFWKRILLPLLFVGAIVLAWIISQNPNNPNNPNNNTTPTPTPTAISTPQPENSFNQIEYLTGSPSNNSRKGIDFFKKGNFSGAATNFYESLKNKQNDPETRIYLNNAVSHSPTRENMNLLGIGASGCSQITSSQTPLKIAAVVSIIQDNDQGKVRDSQGKAQEILRGIAQKQNEINCQGGINGRLLEVIIDNDKEKSYEAKKVAQKLNMQDILGVVGHISSTVIEKASKEYDKNLVAISPTSTAIRNSAQHPTSYSLNENIFRTAVSDEIAIEKLVKYWEKQGSKKIAIASVSGDRFSEIFRGKFIDKIRTSYVHDNNKCFMGDSFRPDSCINEITKNGAEALLLLPNSDNLGKAIEIVEKSPNNLLLLAGDTMYNPNTKNLKEKARNLVIAVSWIRNPNPAEKTLFEREAIKFWPGDINWRTVTSYDATAAIIQGLKNTNKENPTRDDLKAEFSKKNFYATGAIGKVQFEGGDRKIPKDDNGKIVEGSLTGVLVKVKNGDFVEAKESPDLQ